MSGYTSQDGSWKAKEQSEEARFAHEREQQQLAALRDKLEKDNAPPAKSSNSSTLPTGDIEGGYGGQEDLEDRYATTSGEH
ncbi:hypothetical protein M407DRAFT_245080 [Tulasnella calospora MUT 4182]|uniref:Uncharacterized protein n=1 Tax=Tulasnella calospora MUT 4182 TaxID=1051891 RepID=A0A0C3Q2G2_9AGAM|nr:hypothetical protein M407DRAFT_245080 [Tulasnella calospora MUT 4182]